MVTIEAGVAEARAEAVVVRVISIIRYFYSSVLPRYTRPFVRKPVRRQGATSMNAVSPDHILNGGTAAA